MVYSHGEGTSSLLTPGNSNAYTSRHLSSSNRCPLHRFFRPSNVFRSIPSMGCGAAVAHGSPRRCVKKSASASNTV